MATNLRLRRDAEEAVRVEAARTGRSQQEVIRHAVDSYLGLGAVKPVRTDIDALVAEGTTLPARSSFRHIEPSIHLPQGVTSLGLLDRDDRI